MSNIATAQSLLLKWISIKGSVSYQQIKDRCEYLVLQYRIDNYGKPTTHLFYPLLYSGVIDIVGVGKYAATPTCIVSKTKSNIKVISNPSTLNNVQNSSFAGIYIDKNDDAVLSSYNINTVSILSKIPTVEDIIKSCDTIVGYNFDSSEKRLGVIKKSEDGLIRYFVNCDKYQCYILESVSSNPDILNIAAYYERVLKGERNGVYLQSNKELKLKHIGLPIIIFRLLLLESLLNDTEPYLQDGYYVFRDVSNSVTRELNRIFCNSIDIKYE